MQDSAYLVRTDVIILVQSCIAADTKSIFGFCPNSWLTVSSQIVKSALCYKKSYFFNVVQPINLVFCKMIEIIEQNIFNHADFLLRS